MQATESVYHQEFTTFDLDAQASAIMERFNFEEVLEHMEATDWRWHTDGDMKIPTIDELKSTARSLLSKAIWNEKHVSMIATGGFVAWKLPWGMKLEFVITWA